MAGPSRGVVYASFAALLWSTLGVGLKLAVTHLDSFSAALDVEILATVLLLVYLAACRKTGLVLAEFRRQPVFFVCAGALGMGLQQVLYLSAFSLQPAVQTVIAYYLYPPLMVLLAALLFREAMPVRALLLVFLGFAGVVVMVSKGDLTQFRFGIGTLATLGAALCWAAFSVWVKHRRFDVEIGMFLFNQFGTLFLMAAIPFFGFTARVAASEVGMLLYLAAVPTALGFIIWNKALHLTQTSVCAQIALLTPVFSTMLILLVLHEQVSAYHLIGLGVIVVSAYLGLTSRRPEPGEKGRACEPVER